MAISFDTLNSTKTYTFMGPSSGGGSNIFTYTVEVTLNSSNSTQDYFSFDVTLKIMCNQSTFTWMNWSSQRVKLYMNAGSGASTSSEYLIHDAGLPDYSTGQPIVTIFTKEDILIAKPSGTNLYITISVENTTGTSITYLPGSVTNNNTISINITSGLDTMKLYPESAIQNIASAIREVGGGTSTYKVNQMGAAIGALNVIDPTIEFITRTISGNLIIPSSITSLKDYTFYECSNLSTVYGEGCTSISRSAFYSCQNLTSVNFPACIFIGESAFYNCRNLVTANFPSVKSMWGRFPNCRNLKEINFPLCSSIGQYCFYYCSNLSSVNLPICKSVNSMAFACCSALVSIDLPACSSVQQACFSACTNLTTINLPSCTHIGYAGIQRCPVLVSISLPNCTYISYYAFGACRALPSISLPKVSLISTYAFSGCYNLLSIYLLSTSVVSLANSNTFLSTPIAGYTTSTGGVYGSIYVPSSLLASYKAATNWTVYSDRIVGI